MNFIRNSTTKLPSRVLDPRNALFLGSRHSFNPSCYEHELFCKGKTFLLNSNENPQLHAYPYRLLGFQRLFSNAQKSNCIPSSVYARPRAFSMSCGLSAYATVASKVRHLSTSVETGINDNSFERIYIQNSISVKPKSLAGEGTPLDEVGNNVKNTGKGLEQGKGGVSIDSDIEKEAWNLLRDAVVTYCGYPVGTVAANDPGDKQPLNYDQVFIRDFVPSALAFLLKGEGEIVKNFLLHTLQLQSWEKTVDCYSPGQGLMPASFKVRTVPIDDNKSEEVLDPDFGEAAIGRVAPVDSGLWWIILLRAYGKITGDYSLQERVDVQTGMKLILNLCLADGFDMFPSLLVTDGSCMIDRRMGIHGHPLEIQALFYAALRSSREMLTNEGSNNLKSTPWMLPTNSIFIRSKFLPGLWTGYLKKNEAILNLIEYKWNDIVGQMPLKICYPAVENEEWRIITGCDPKNTPWSYHNGGSWPTLLWQFTLACIKMGRLELANKAIDLAEKRLSRDHWPEYYDTRSGKFIGKQSRLYQTWTIAGFLTSKMMVKNPEMASLLFWEEDFEILEICVCALSKGGRIRCSRGAAKSQILV
ncbi:hypothetical protein V6N12_015613 [Hibiscus sabdariffa]|uniref:Alkaline/neutral invertase n=1 Tax=Hibiscus sabdariffa TaxID=183260 RepID=A0ABR2DNM6_9ROSI